MPRIGKTTAKRLQIEKRRYKAIHLRKSGATYRVIAAKLAGEYGTKYSWQAAYQDIETVLRQIREETRLGAEELVRLELERYDSYLLALAPKLQQGDTSAISEAIKISDRRSKLLGLDAPIQVKIQQGIESGLELELEQFLDSLRMALDRDVFVQVLTAVGTLQTRSPKVEGD
ncbi:MAG TPA: hypothetical protein V6D18_16625 [Thermosynechococcaceae cyanobacterium]